MFGYVNVQLAIDDNNLVGGIRDEPILHGYAYDGRIMSSDFFAVRFVV